MLAPLPDRLFWIKSYNENGELRDASEIKVHEFIIGLHDRTSGLTIFEFGVDHAGEIYVAGISNNRGIVRKIVPLPDPGTLGIMVFAAMFSLVRRTWFRFACLAARPRVYSHGAVRQSPPPTCYCICALYER